MGPHGVTGWLMSDLKKLNLRLPGDLHAALIELAQSERLSVNALMVRELERQVRYWLPKARQRQALGQIVTDMPGASTPRSVKPVPRVGVNQPCPCGSGQKYKRCHGKA